MSDGTILPGPQSYSAILSRDYQSFPSTDVFQSQKRHENGNLKQVRPLLNYEGMDIRNYLFGGDTRQMVYKSLDASVLRGKAISQNLANIQTPGYQRKEVNFEEQLIQAMKAKLDAANTQPNHISGGKGLDLSSLNPFVYEPKDETLPGEINNVDVDMEAAKMAENQIYYQMLTKFVGFGKLNSAISGRGQS